MGPRADLDFSRNKIRFPLAAFEHGTVHPQPSHCTLHYRGADKSLARPGRKQATATEDFDVIYPIYCRSQWPRGLRRRSTAARPLRL